MLFFEGNVENRLKPINSSKIAFFFSPSANMAQDAIINAKLVFFPYFQRVACSSF